jgi:hypothetical protein
VSPQIMHLAGSVSHCSCSAGRCSKLEARPSPKSKSPRRSAAREARCGVVVLLAEHKRTAPGQRAVQ